MALTYDSKKAQDTTTRAGLPVSFEGAEDTVVRARGRYVLGFEILPNGQATTFNVCPSAFSVDSQTVQSSALLVESQSPG